MVLLLRLCAMKSDDLFLYCGHGNARQYIPHQEIVKVNASCDVCLFGCCSGYIRNTKSRVPDGAPLDYLLAGCPCPLIISIFLYCGHGNARQYVTRKEIVKVNASCAVCLFGCCSGYIRNTKSRVRAPLDYLLAGCPVIISNLWPVSAISGGVLSRKLLESLLEAARASNNEETSDIASLLIGALEIEHDDIHKPDFKGTVIYGIPRRVCTPVSEDLSQDDMLE